MGEKKYSYNRNYIWARIAKSVWRLATSWMVRGSNPGEGENFCNRSDRPWLHPASYTMDIGSHSQGQSGQDVALTTHLDYMISNGVNMGYQKLEYVCMYNVPWSGVVQNIIIHKFLKYFNYCLQISTPSKTGAV
jgi:hypothetical protein